MIFEYRKNKSKNKENNLKLNDNPFYLDKQDQANLLKLRIIEKMQKLVIISNENKMKNYDLVN